MLRIFVSKRKPIKIINKKFRKKFNKKKKNLDWLLDDEDSSNIEVKDANWNLLQDGDSVVSIKDIKVKWASDIKRWDKFVKIRLTDDRELIESGNMVLRTEFFKKI